MITMILLEQPVALDPQKLKQAFSQLDPEITYSVIIGDKTSSETAMVTWGGVNFAVMAIDQPIPLDSFRGGVIRHSDSEVIASAISTHKAHLIISPMLQGQSMVDSILTATALTKKVALLGRLMGGMATFWSSAGVMICQQKMERIAAEVISSPQLMVDEAELSRGLLPYRCWVGRRLETYEDIVMVATQGLDDFAGYEIELQPLDWPRKKVVDCLYRVVAHLFQNGPVLGDGGTIQVSEDDIFHVRMHRRDGCYRALLSLQPQYSSLQ